MPKRERKWDHVECSVKTTEGGKRQVTETGTKNKDSRQKALAGVVETNPAAPAVSLNFSDPDAPIKGQAIIRMDQNTQLSSLLSTRNPLEM